MHFISVLENIKTYIKMLLHVLVYDHHQGACIEPSYSHIYENR